MSTHRAVLLAVSAAVLLQLPAPAHGADVRVQIDLGLPATPPLVTIEPGVMVVEGWGHEVFLVGGVYWARADGRWYTARAPRAPFVVVEERRVPPSLRRIPPGHYKHWKGPHGHGHEADGKDGRGNGRGKHGKGHDKD